MDLDDPTRTKLVELCQSVHRKVSPSSVVIQYAPAFLYLHDPHMHARHKLQDTMQHEHVLQYMLTSIYNLEHVASKCVQLQTETDSCVCWSQMRDVSEDFKAELGRANYVTPTSYLELITMFQRLVTAKRIENSKTLSRYTVGLDKLQSSAQQVAGMQQELRVSQACVGYLSLLSSSCMPVHCKSLVAFFVG